ncbi:MAG: hypothetical protein CMF51_03330 [Legionellales bacterium]|nr:hypothetical protein [Legionellales bacterium]
MLTIIKESLKIAGRVLLSVVLMTLILSFSASVLAAVFGAILMVSTVLSGLLLNLSSQGALYWFQNPMALLHAPEYCIPISFIMLIGCACAFRCLRQCAPSIWDCFTQPCLAFSIDPLLQEISSPFNERSTQNVHVVRPFCDKDIFVINTSIRMKELIRS